MRKIFFVIFAVGVVGCSAAGAAEPPGRVAALQDENFFLQDEIRKLKGELVDKDAAIRGLLLAKETALYNQAQVVKEKTLLEVKVDTLQKMVLERDKEFPQQLEQAAVPYRTRMEEAIKDQKVLSMTIEQKDVRIAAMAAEGQAVQAKIDTLTGEKIALRASLKQVADELDALKKDAQGDLAAEKNACDEKVKDLQVRLGAEQTLVQEKIALAQKPLEDKLAASEAAGKAAELEAARKAALDRIPLQERISQLEKQIALLRESAGLEVKKFQEQLDACRKAAVPQR